ncbi:DAK2 domain-containing protein [Cryobacterium tagatosivorans]|uniref:DAK2 domain-containing protein n=1 Tax=Cryobacterium tagatosivorans TaxID=1259199 RepID=A0A4R8UGU8_9MICO|nr:DAK2 domain-containing protein [Cryobacterium tagatosivorans]TFB55386.1 DAK2 domain-containing protein [Cryobacterium tagatosivorans]
MDATGLSRAIRNTMVEIKQYADELRDLDTALGDGDLGITVSLGADAIVEALDAAGDDVPPEETIRTCAKAFANANPSTMAALVAGALLSGSRLWATSRNLTTVDASAFAKAAGDSISKRGKSVVGDKTILDALVPAGEALGTSSSASEALDRAITAAKRAIAETTSMQSRRGRASWLQERSIGLQDPGATAFLRFLESWKAANVAD